jgi:hypothetical protein
VIKRGHLPIEAWLNDIADSRTDMPEQPTADDLEKAHLILSEFGLLIGPAGAVSDVIARAVAAGIALGRKEALTKTRRSGESKRRG